MRPGEDIWTVIVIGVVALPLAAMLIGLLLSGY